MMQIFDAGHMIDDDTVFKQIIDHNMTSMLYCVRSKETCVEIVRLFIRNNALFEDIKIQVLKIDRISKIQTKKDIFNDISTSVN